MIDFHTHILPNIDDGSRSQTESSQLLQEEVRQGVSQIVATPHFYADRMQIDDFLNKRRQSFTAWQASLDGTDDARLLTRCREIRLGAEVYFFPGMGRADRLRELTIEGTDTILVEMPFAQWTEDVFRELQDIINRQKLQIVLAHIERYPEFQRDKGILNRVLQLPLTLQINGGSFLKGRTRRKFCVNLLREKQNVILGSDCHNMTSRRPNLQEARAYIEKKCGMQKLDRIDALSRQLIQRDR